MLSLTSKTTVDVTQDNYTPCMYVLVKTARVDITKVLKTLSTFFGFS